MNTQTVNTVASNQAKAIANYTNAFLGCYPHKNIKVTSKKEKRETVFTVSIDGDTGGRSLSYSELLSSTADFLRGKTK